MTKSSANGPKEIESVAAGNENKGETSFCVSLFGETADVISNNPLAAVTISPGIHDCVRSLTKTLPEFRKTHF